MAIQNIYYFYAELEDYEPKIWRRFEVSSNVTLSRLGYIIMTMFEMQASHLFSFEVSPLDNYLNYKKNQSTAKEFKVLEELIANAKAKTVGTTNQSYEIMNEYTDNHNDENVENVFKTKLKHVISHEKEKMFFDYDFGDGWRVTLTLEKNYSEEISAKEFPRVLDGSGYGIVEDCGGPHGLEQLAKAFKRKKGREYTEYCEWLGVDNLDLESFDIDDMNFRLKKVPRIYLECYEYDMAPSKNSLAILERRYKN